MYPILETAFTVVGFVIFLVHLIGPERLDRAWQKLLLKTVDTLGRLAIRWLLFLHNCRRHLLR